MHVDNTIAGLVAGLDVQATPEHPVRFHAFITPPGGERVQVTTAEPRVQSVLEAAFAGGRSVEVTFAAEGHEKIVTRARVLDRAPHVIEPAVKRPSQMERGKYATKNPAGAVVAEVWVSDDPSLGYKVEYWVFYNGYWRNEAPGGKDANGNTRDDTTFAFGYKPNDAGASDRDTEVQFLSYTDNLKDANGNPLWEQRLRAPCRPYT